jgi:hypothetical protein
MACSLNTMLQKELKNEVPEAVLRQCPEADQVLVENILRLAQAELVVMNLASTTVTSMRSLQAYSPARVLEVLAVVHDGNMRVCLLLQDLLQSCARGGGGEWRTCAMRYDEPRLVWTRLITTH